jgi:hypothetical protein
MFSSLNEFLQESIPMTRNNSNYSFLHPKNFYAVIRIPPKYYFMTHDRMKKRVVN